MKTCITRFLWAALPTVASDEQIHAQGTAFTCRGRLNSNGLPANGTYELRFALFDAARSGTQIGQPIMNSSFHATIVVYKPK